MILVYGQKSMKVSMLEKNLPRVILPEFRKNRDKNHLKNEKFTIKEMCGFVEFLERDEIVELLEKLDFEIINLPKICRLYTKLHKYNIETSIFFTEVEETLLTSNEETDDFLRHLTCLVQYITSQDFDNFRLLNILFKKVEEKIEKFDGQELQMKKLMNLIFNRNV